FRKDTTTYMLNVFKLAYYFGACDTIPLDLGYSHDDYVYIQDVNWNILSSQDTAVMLNDTIYPERHYCNSDGTFGSPFTNINNLDNYKTPCVYPNPVDDYINVYSATPVKCIKLFDCLGREIRTDYISKNRIYLGNLK